MAKFKEGSATLFQRPPCSRAGLEKSSPPIGKGQGELGCERLPPQNVGLVVKLGSIPEVGKGPVCPFLLCHLLFHHAPHAPHRGYGPFTQPLSAPALLPGQTQTALPPILPSVVNPSCAGSNREAPKDPIAT